MRLDALTILGFRLEVTAEGEAVLVECFREAAARIVWFEWDGLIENTRGASVAEVVVSFCEEGIEGVRV